MEGGYAGNILYVDLTTGASRKEGLNADFVRGFIGGFGINSRLAFDLIKPGTDPLSPDNPIIIGAGALTGTCPGGTKIVGTTRIRTGFIRSAVGGGGAMLKWAGYDHVVITGRAQRPAYLKVFDDEVELCDAGGLWGKDTHETADELWRRYGRECSSIVIGQAGERLNAMALGFIDKQLGHFGKGGLASIMASKNLKAIVFRGTKGIKVADRARFTKLFDDLLHTEATWTDLQAFVKLAGSMPKSFDEYNAVLGGFPTQNASTVYPKDKLRERFQKTWTEQLDRTSLACIGCPASCKFMLELKSGEHAGLVTYARPIRVMLFASERNLEDWGQVLKCLDFVHRHGIDMHTAGPMISWLVELYEREIISREQTDGLVLRHDYDTTIKLLEKMANRQGFGDTLASGWKAAIEHIGKGSEKYARQVKGMTPTIDPRHFKLGTYHVSEAINSAAHTAVGSSPTYYPDCTLDTFKAWCDGAGIPANARERIFAGPGGFNIGRYTKHAEDWRRVLDSLGICGTAPIMRMYSARKFAELYSALTGTEVSPADMLRAGERAHNLERALNAREGFGRKDDAFPERWLEPLRAGGKEFPLRHYFDPTPLTRDEVKKVFDEYYEERGWERETGNPSKAKLRELELDYVVAEMEQGTPR